MVLILVLLLTVVPFQAVQSSDRIVGGTDAREGSYPWLAEIKHSKRGHFCGGSLILDGNWVLTAAHCVEEKPLYNISTSDMMIVLGEYKLSEESGHEQVISMKEIFLHPAQDVALVRLQQTPSFNRYVRTIELSDQQLSVGNPLTVAGWGTIEVVNRTKTLPDTLQQLQVPVVDPDDCDYLDEDSEFCVGYTGDAFINVCFGDSGSPGIFRRTHRQPWKQYGIASWVYGPPCQDPTHYAVFADVSSAYPWIQGVVQGYSCGENED